MAPSIQIRSAVPADTLGVAQVHVHSWQAAYRGLPPQHYLDSLRAEDRAACYDFSRNDAGKPLTRVAVSGDIILGFATTMPYHDEALTDFGELCALYVDPNRWGIGLGVALVTDARERMRHRGFRHAVLWLLNGNVRADRFYRNDSWFPDGAHKREVMWGIDVEELRYQRPLT